MGNTFRVDPERYLIISDLQMHFEAEKALEFCYRIYKSLRIPKENVICVGDEVDQYFGSRYDKSIDATETCNQELQITRDKIKRWASVFPKMRVCISNHGMRWAKKAAGAELPSQMLRHYQEVLRIPDTWKYKLEWRIPTKHPFRVIHGMGYSGERGHVNAALDAGMSTAMGHLTHMGIHHIRKGISENYKPAQKIWGMCVSCLVDLEAYAFHYGRDYRNKPGLGTGAVINDGRMPILYPYDL